jgi:hypothetical protein
VPRSVKPSREYHETLRRSGVKNPGDTLWQLPIQLVNVVDDLTYMRPPIVQPIAGGGVFQAGVAVQQTIPVEVHVLSQGGAWLIATANSSPASTAYLGLYCDTASHIAVGATAFTPDFLVPPDGSVPLQSTFTYGYATAGITAEVRLVQATSILSPSMGPVWLPFGSFVGLQCTLANQAATGWIMIREIPIGAPGDA